MYKKHIKIVNFKRPTVMSLIQQLRWDALINNNSAYRTWKCRAREYNLEMDGLEYVMNGYAWLHAIKKETKNAKSTQQTTSRSKSNLA